VEICNNRDDNCDGVIDEGFADSDGDGVPDCRDNCTTVANPNQWDCDNDGIGDACGDNCTLVLCSTAASDGWLSRNSQNSFSSNSGNTLITGDAKVSGKQTGYRSVVSFDTASLDDQSQIVTATLTLTPQAPSVSGGVGAGTSFTTLGVEMMTGSFGSAGLQGTDYSATATGSLASSLPFPTTSSDVNPRTVTLAGTELTWINKTGRTEFRLEFNNEWDGDGISDQVKWRAGEAGSGACPTLTIQYTAP
jgi:hypothetical protein